MVPAAASGNGVTGRFLAAKATASTNALRRKVDSRVEPEVVVGRRD
jgi:hypothetical protein